MSRSVPSLPTSVAAVLRPSGGGNAAVMTSKSDMRRWRPNLPGADQHPCHNEIFTSSADGAGAGLALALARDALKASGKGALEEVDDQRHILWVQTRDAIRRCGRPYCHGFPPELRRRLICVEAKDAQDALFALEEGVQCSDLAFVVGEVLGNPRTLDFTASRRLTLTAQKHGSRLYLVRVDAQRDLSSARMRWDVRSVRSPRPRWNADAPGRSAWKAELFRARAHPFGEWILHDDAGTLSIPADVITRPSVTIPQAANTPGSVPANGQASGQASTGIRAADYGDMARATVGRSLAAL